MTGTFEYGNWIRKKVLWVLGLSTLGMGVLGVLPLPLVVRIISGSLCAILFISFLFPLYAYYMFSAQGGNLQEKFYDLIVEKAGNSVSGKFLDIGAGNGMLTVKLAQTHRDAQVVGMDYWGKAWEYSMSVCAENARRAKVSEQVSFVKGDAASLDFVDATFDTVVSNLTFHEVRSVKQKEDVVAEALRVLKHGGTFAFIDYFYDAQYYGPLSQLQVFLQDLGLSTVEVKPLHDMITIPRILLHPKALGKVGIIYGKK